MNRRYNKDIMTAHKLIKGWELNEFNAVDPGMVWFILKKWHKYSSIIRTGRYKPEIRDSVSRGSGPQQLKRSLKRIKGSSVNSIQNEN